MSQDIRLTATEIHRLADRIAEVLDKRSQSDSMIDAVEASELLGCSLSTIERMTKCGVLPSVKIGRLRRYRRTALLALKLEKGEQHGNL